MQGAVCRVWPLVPTCARGKAVRSCVRPTHRKSECSGGSWWPASCQPSSCCSPADRPALTTRRCRRRCRRHGPPRPPPPRRRRPPPPCRRRRCPPRCRRRWRPRRRRRPWKTLLVGGRRGGEDVLGRGALVALEPARTQFECERTYPRVVEGRGALHGHAHTREPPGRNKQGEKRGGSGMASQCTRRELNAPLWALTLALPGRGHLRAARSGRQGLPLSLPRHFHGRRVTGG